VQEDGEELSDGLSSEAVRVTRTGIALVHEGELVFPADASEAEAEYVADERYTVHYHFPVEIEIRGRAEPPSDTSVLRSHQLFALSLDGL